jgi:hypothetical protein
MKDSQRRTHEMFERVRDFGAANAAAFPDGSKGKELFDELDSVLAQLNDHAEAQVSTQGAAAGGSVSRKAARERLRDQLEAVARTARAMSFETPELAARFRLPRGNNDQSLLDTARSFRANATPLKAEFVSHEMPADFLEELAAAVADFESAVTEQNTSRVARSAATAAVEEATARGSALVRQLDAVVRNKLRDDAARLAAWEAASRTERAPRRTQPPAQPEPQ